MPPASLPALAAISPGPRNASATKTRLRRLNPRNRSLLVKARMASLFVQGEPPAPAAREYELQYVVDGDNSLQALVVVDDPDHGQVEVGHQPRNLLDLGVDAHGARMRRDVGQHRGWISTNQVGERDRAEETALGVHHEHH